MKKFCESSIEHEKYNCSWKEKILPLTKEELKSHQVTKVYYICGKKTLKKLSNSRNYWKVRGRFYHTDKYIGAARR